MFSLPFAIQTSVLSPSLPFFFFSVDLQPCFLLWPLVHLSLLTSFHSAAIASASISPLCVDWRWGFIMLFPRLSYLFHSLEAWENVSPAGKWKGEFPLALLSHRGAMVLVTAWEALQLLGRRPTNNVYDQQMRTLSLLSLKGDVE